MRVLCAAIHYQNGKQYEHQPKNIQSGIVVCGYRHGNCFVVLSQFLPKKRSASRKIEQGFLTDDDRFVSRQEGFTIAKAAGQVILNPERENERLFSEDLY